MNAHLQKKAIITALLVSWGHSVGGFWVEAIANTLRREGESIVYCVRLSTSVPHFPTNNKIGEWTASKGDQQNNVGKLYSGNIEYALELGTARKLLFSISRSKIATEMSELLLGHKLWLLRAICRESWTVNGKENPYWYQQWREYMPV